MSHLVGSVEVGKLADLVVLSGNPLDVRTVDLLSLEVTSTWSHGVLVYSQVVGGGG